MINGAEYSAAPVKVDRSKLYGWTELKALDDEGRECQMVNMDETGTVIIPKGGLGLGILSPEGQWVDRGSLKAVKPDGSDAPPVASSFSSPIELKDAVDDESFLDHNISLVYQLDDAPAELIAAVGEKIFGFCYAYRDGFKGDPAFVLASGGSLFMLVGQKTEYEMLSLAEASAVDDEDQGDDEEGEDDLDFSAM